MIVRSRAYVERLMWSGNVEARKQSDND